MLDLPGHPVLDKQRILGGCVRLNLQTDPERLRDEGAALTSRMRGTTAGRVGVHSAAEALFLRGYAPAEGLKPIEDREALRSAPYIRTLLKEVIPAPPLRSLLAKLPPRTTIRPHIDDRPYFSKSLRVHIPIETNPNVWMLCAGMAYHMVPGEVWVLNNSAEHGVLNRDEAHSRTHLICDFLPTPQLLALISDGDRDLGRPMSAISRPAAAMLASES